MRSSSASAKFQIIQEQNASGLIQLLLNSFLRIGRQPHEFIHLYKPDAT